MDPQELTSVHLNRSKGCLMYFRQAKVAVFKNTIGKPKTGEYYLLQITICELAVFVFSSLKRVFLMVYSF
jgi:hypothetical protein